MNSVPSRPFKAVVFDLDGTLIDSAPDLRLAANHLLAENGRAPLTVGQVIKMVGDGVRKLVERAFAATGDAVSGADLDALGERFLHFYEGHAADLSRPFPGAEAAVAHLHGQGCVLGVCTNKPRQPALEILDALGLGGYIHTVLGGDSLDGIRKPDPRHLLATIERLGATPGEAVMVGDNENDVAVARAAGVPVIAVTFGYARGAPEDLGADLLIDHFDELAEALGRLSRQPSLS